MTASHPSAAAGLSRALAVGVAALACAVLALEVALTRLFSVVFRYHFVFLVVSMSICGLGLGGLLVHQWRRRGGGQGALDLTVLACAFSLLIPFSVVLLLRVLLPYWPAQYVGAAVLVLLPFVAAGMFLSRAFELSAQLSGKLYAADLIGAACGCLVALGALQTLGAINACFAVGCLAGAAGLAVAGHDGRLPGHRQRLWLALGCVLVNAGLLAVNRQSGPGASRFDVPVLRTQRVDVAKPLWRELAAPGSQCRIVRTVWNAFARTDVVEDRQPGVNYLHIYADGEVPTEMMQFDGDVAKVADLREFIGFGAFRLGPTAQVLCLGPGGGLDLLLALLAGAERIEGAEINPSIPALMREYRAYNGGLYEHPKVHISIAEGRSYLRASRAAYDVIYLALTQTATSGSLGLALVESYVHTADAFAEYLGHLTPAGRVALVTQEYPLLIRGVTTALSALERYGVPPARALDHLVVLVLPEVVRGGAAASMPYRCLLLAYREPVSSAVRQEAAEFAQRLNLVALHIPGVAENPPLSLLRNPTVSIERFAGLLAEGHVSGNVRPCSDDRPFFLDLTTGVPPMLLQLLGATLALIIGFSAWVLRCHRANGAVWLRCNAGFVAYFSCLGTGFMLIEIALAQKLILFLGYPTLTLSVILFALLLGGGVGSYLSQRVAETQTLRLAAGAALLVAIVGAALPSGLTALIYGAAGLPLAARITATLVVLFPLGCLLGVPFPCGLRGAAGVVPDSVAWFWGVNGVMSVLGSILAAVGAKLAGFSLVLIAGAIVYLVAGALALAMARSMGETNKERASP